jgi:uncharacterized protein (TIGR00251 family)
MTIIATMAELRIQQLEGRVRFAVHVQPRASRSAIGRVHGDALRVRLTAPPVEGAANAALVALLADALRVPKRSVRIVAGETSRAKTVEVDGINAAGVQRLAAATGERLRASARPRIKLTGEGEPR